MKWPAEQQAIACESSPLPIFEIGTGKITVASSAASYCSCSRTRCYSEGEANLFRQNSKLLAIHEFSMFPRYLRTHTIASKATTDTLLQLFR
jgi:hypothetical protein